MVDKAAKPKAGTKRGPRGSYRARTPYDYATESRRTRLEAENPKGPLRSFIYPAEFYGSHPVIVDAVDLKDARRRIRFGISRWRWAPGEKNLQLRSMRFLEGREIGAEELQRLERGAMTTEPPEPVEVRKEEDALDDAD